MDTVLILLGVVCLLVGLEGCVLPVLKGTVLKLTCVGLMIYYFVAAVV